MIKNKKINISSFNFYFSKALFGLLSVPVNCRNAGVMIWQLTTGYKVIQHANVNKLFPRRVSPKLKSFSLPWPRVVFVSIVEILIYLLAQFHSLHVHVHPKV